MALARVTDDEYMLHSHVIVEQKDDCFYKMDQFCNAQKKAEVKTILKKTSTTSSQRIPKKLCVSEIDSDGADDEGEHIVGSRLCVLHSRYASKRGTMRD